MERKQIPGCWSLRRLSLFYSYYAIIDTDKYLADQLFINHEVRVWFGQEYSNHDWPYIVILCKCRKRDAERFEAAMEELPKKMMLCGHPDYIDFCIDLKSKLEDAREHGGEFLSETACPPAQAEQKS